MTILEAVEQARVHSDHVLEAVSAYDTGTANFHMGYICAMLDAIEDARRDMEAASTLCWSSAELAEMLDKEAGDEDSDANA